MSSERLHSWDFSSLTKLSHLNFVDSGYAPGIMVLIFSQSYYAWFILNYYKLSIVDIIDIAVIWNNPGQDLDIFKAPFVFNPFIPDHPDNKGDHTYWFCFE